MPYCTQSDIEEQIPQAELINLTDDAGSGGVDASAVARAIADADAEIDAYCGARYTVPFSPAPVMIRKLSVDLAIYHLFSRRALKVSEDRKARYDNAIRFLRDVSLGRISLGADAPAETDTSDSVNMDTSVRVFTRDKMRGY